MAELKINGAVVFTNRAEVKQAIKQHLKDAGVASGSIHSPTEVDECKAILDELDTALLVIDWEAGPDAVIGVLEHNKGKFKSDTRPTFMLSAQVDPGILAVAAEYGVSKIHTGEITVAQIKDTIRGLVKETKELTPVKQIMVKVAECYKNGDVDGAAVLLETLYKKDPNNPRAAVEFAENCMQRDHWDKAEELLKTAVESDPPYARAQHLLARVYLKKGRREDAVAALEGAQLISPMNTGRLAEMGNLFLEMDKPNKAKEAFTRILSVDSDSKAAKSGQSKSMLVMGQVNEALSLLKDFSNAREMASVFNTSAILSAEKGRHDAAMKLYDAAMVALEKSPKLRARLMFNKGIGFVKWKKVKEGLKCFQEAVKLDPTYEDAQHNLSVLQSSKKKPASASIDQGVAEDLSGMEESFSPSQQVSGGSLNFATDFDDDFDVNDF